MRPPDLPVTRIKNIHFKNPFVILAQATSLTNPNGRVTPEVLMYYKSLARSEAAVVIAGPATVTPPNSRKYSLLRVDQPKYLDGLRALSKIIHSNGSIPGIQVVHPGAYEANEIQAGVSTFKGDIDDFAVNKLLTAYRNAGSRSLEVGFRYVELCATGHLLLHRMVEEDREDLLAEVFSQTLKSIGDEGILGFRVNPAVANAEKYARLFLEAGGDLVCMDGGAELAGNHDGKLMITLKQPHPGEQLRNLIGSVQLYGMDVAFKGKHDQVLHYFRG
ncbi:MAG: hypothetical protein QNK37_08440 [Acidobacteriota bacterium]|nr:hypothetical protein [Acidobacteriota bacterium]